MPRKTPTGNVTSRALSSSDASGIRDKFRPLILHDDAGLMKTLRYPYAPEIRRPADHPIGFMNRLPMMAGPMLAAVTGLYPGPTPSNTVERAMDALRVAIVPCFEQSALSGLSLEELPSNILGRLVTWMDTEALERGWTRKMRKAWLSMLRRVLVKTGRCHQVEHLPDPYTKADHDVQHRQPPSSATLTALVQVATRDVREISAMRAALDDLDHPYHSDPVKGRLLQLAAEIRDRYPGVPPHLDWLYANDKVLANKIVRLGHRRVVGIYCPSAAQIVPLAILMAAYFRLDGQMLADLTRDGDRLEKTIGPERVVVDVFKKRGGQALTPSYPADESPDNPKQLIALIKRLTEPLVAFAAPCDTNRLFLMRHKDDPAKVATFDHEAVLWQALNDYCAKHKLKMTSSQIRRGILDIVALVTNSDPALKAVAAGHTTPRTGSQFYTSTNEDDAADERLAAVRAVADRARRTEGCIDPTAGLPGEDATSATPGWVCDRPYSGPPGYRTTRGLCEAYGMCVICDHGRPVLDSPRSCARAHGLLNAIKRSQPHMPEPVWIGRWMPVAHRLEYYWLPQFTDRARIGAKKLSLPPMMMVVYGDDN
jgi:hypothetical protein